MLFPNWMILCNNCTDVKKEFSMCCFFCSQIDFVLQVTTMCLCKNISWILLTVKLISKEWIHTYKDKWKWYVNKFLKDFTFKETGCAHQEMTRDQLNDTTTSVLFFAVKLFWSWQCGNCVEMQKKLHSTNLQVKSCHIHNVNGTKASSNQVPYAAQVYHRGQHLPLSFF